MKPFRNRTLAFLSGIAILFVVLEISLRFVGGVYSNLSESDNVADDNREKTILCIGDSVTFGIGAPREFSYPAQFQVLLEQFYPEKRIKVVNRGWPAQNTAQIYDRLENWLQTIRPDFVTILIGAQNRANFYGYQDYLDDMQMKKRGVFVLHNLLDHIRVYKFFRLILREHASKDDKFDPAPNVSKTNIMNKTGKPVDENGLSLSLDETNSLQKITPQCATAFQYRNQGQYSQAFESIFSVIDQSDIDSDCYGIAGLMYQDQQKYDQAIEWYKKGIQKDSGNFRLYEGIGASYREQGQAEEALYWYKEGFANARNTTIYERCYLEIALIFMHLGTYPEAIDFFDMEMERRSGSDGHLQKLARDYKQMFTNQNIDPEIARWIEADMKKIIQLCRRYNAEPVIQNYPVEPMVNFIYKKIADEENLLFVDQEIVFKDYVRDLGRELDREYFAPDGHPNKKGYALMAEKLNKTLQARFKEN